MRGIITLLLTFLTAASVWAQTGTVAGRIFDAETGDPLPGANVLLVELQRGAASDTEGRFLITDVPAGTYTLRVSFVGYRTHEEQIAVRAGETTTVEVELKPDYTGLEEVVVTGIASERSKMRAEVAVSKIDAAELQVTNAYQDISQLMSSKVAGVKVLPATGNLGGGVRFVMRAGGGLNGDGQPIIIIDGVRIDNSEFDGFYVGGQGISMLSNLDPEDIESIEVLKGPAGAALYGTSGANGVVIITTKKGRVSPGRGIVSFNYKGVTGYHEQAKEYDTNLLESADDANTIFRRGPIRQHTLSLAGGTPALRYYAALDFRDENGHTPQNKLARQNFRANFEAVPSEKIVFRANTSFVTNKIQRPINDNNIYGWLGNTLLFPSSYRFTDSTAISKIQDFTRIHNFVGSLEAIYTPIKNLEFKASFGFDGSDLRQDQTWPPDQPYQTITKGRRAIFYRRNRQFTYDLYGRYRTNLMRDLQSVTTVGAQLFERTLRTTFLIKENFQTPLITNVGSGQDFINADEGFTNTREAGVYINEELAYQDRLFVTLGLRRDYAASIGPKAPSIYYPQARFAVLLDRFGLRPPYVSFWKVRTAYGETGVLPNLLDASRLLWSAEPSGFGTGAVVAFIGNEEIRPERIKELEVGTDINFFQDNLALEFTYFWQFGRESIIDFLNPPSTGLTASAVPKNVGKIDGWGYEFSLSATPYRTRNTQVDFTFQWSYANNEVKDLGGAPPIFDGFDINVIKEGLPRSAFYTWEVKGAKFNPDGTYAGPDVSEDRVFAGVPIPKHNGSFSLTLRLLRNLRIYGLVDWALGHKLLNNTLVFATRFGNRKEFNELATKLGLAGSGVAAFVQPVEGIEPLTPGTPEYEEAANQFARMDWRYDYNYLEKADYLKLREVSISYDFTDLMKKYAGNAYVKHFTVSLSGRNLFVSTKYSLPDPEVNWAGGRGLSIGQDFLTLPAPRTVYLTVNIGL